MFDNSKDNPYIIDDEDVHHDHRVAAVKHEFQQFGDWWQPSDRTHRGTQDELSIELEVEDRLVDEIAEVIDLTDDVDPTPTIRSREGMRSGLERELPSFTLNDGLLIRPGLSFEIKNPETAGMAFFKVISVVQRFSFDGSSQTFLRGWGFARTRRLQGELPRKQNELFLFSNMENGCSDSWERQSLTDISPTAVKKVRDLRITNSEFPEFRFTAESFHAHGKGWVDENGPLVCRYRREAWFNPGSQVPTETALVRITEAEADPNYRWEDAHLVNRWRGGKVPGGSHPHGLVLDVDKHQEHHPAKLQPGQKYTAGDIFAGAGGASRGIERAGLRLLFSLDHWGPAANSLRMNFSKTDVHECEVTDFILNKDIRYEVDILHLSPPCQFWSPAHTTAGKDDEQNIDVLFSCEHLIKKLRPRLFTVEQTFGIIHARFSQYFAMLIHGFTAHGYSVRWKVVVLANYGVPQSRKRLIMIGAGPGERLPPFPPPTHSKGGGGGGAGGLPRWVTPRAALAKVRHITAEENKQHVKKRFDVPKPAWDPSRMAKTITCGGGQNYHWNGTRDFTKLEYAVLQGFPTWHKFSDVAVKKQIGNAFAPSVVRIFYRHLVRWLLRHDGFDPAEIERASASASANNLVASTAAAATRPIRIRDDVEMIDLDGDDDDDDDDDNNNNNNDQDGNGNLDKQQDDQTKKDDGDELIFLRARGVGKGNSIIVNNPEEVMEIDSDGGGGDDDNDDEDYSYPSSDSSGTLVMSDDDDDDDNDEVVDVEIPEELLWII